MNTNTLTQEIVSRKNSTAFSGFLGLLPNPDKMFRISGDAYETLRKLKDDPHVWSCIQSRKSGTLSLEHTILGTGNIKSEIESIIADIDIRGLIRDILEAPLFGFQPIELIWQHTGKYFVPVKTEAKPHELFQYNSEGNIVLTGIKELQNIEIPEGKLLIPRYEASFQNPYGHSLLSKCYWSVKFKTGGMRFWVNFTERYGMPLLLGQYTRGATQEETQKLADALANMTEDTVIVSPADINISMHEASKSSSVELYKELIKQCNAEISKALLSQTLTTELDMGSYAAAQTHYKIRKEVIMSDVRIVEANINKLIKYICKFNFDESEIPKFKILMNDSENLNLIERDTKLAAAGIKFTKDYWEKTYGFNNDDIE